MAFNRKLGLRILLCALAGTFGAAAPAPDYGSRTSITDSRIDPERETVTPGAYIVVTDRKLAAIGAGESAARRVQITT